MLFRSGVGGASDAVWHTLLGIETGVEPLVSPSHLMLFLGAFLMLDYVFTTRPSKDQLDTASVVAVSTIYALVMFITQFLHPYLQYEVFFGYDDAFAAGTLFFNQCLQALFMFMRYDLKCHQSKCSCSIFSLLCMYRCMLL